ncbi:putative bifunctional diguanylate cyclase/phosphodiesterase [Colwellia psychrerythraea]|uniref:Diguanylate cyclase/phosphodiesterase n=1 Tax=Colwellia psychrerythraea TaxID=28229 RepID=A0A099KLN7_COLPS|nr:GGDEF domain-containing phosphodiesterase [Colwellia psychrerythraea]KGJ91120.1 diguanylate cyclase/phosphodiesterase [Colwellia psychrerythraea]
MIEYFKPQTFLYATQAVAFSVLLFVFVAYYQTFFRKYVKYWLVCITALTVSYFIKAVSPSITGNWLLIAEFIQQVCQYYFLFFLILGVYNAKKNKEIPKKISWAGVGGIIGISLATTVLFAFDPDQAFNHFYLTVSLPSFIFGCSLFALATYLLFDKKSYFSSQVLMYFSAVFGLRYLIHSFISIVALTEPWFRQLELFLIYFDVAAHNILGFTLLIWMQGAERFAALNAINRAQYLGKHDSLTGALNRGQVMAQLSDKLHELSEINISNTNQLKLAVFLIDIKQFKFVNDTYGLKVGDYILGEIARRLNHSVFMPQAVGRLSGDSFMFVIEFEQLSHVDRAVSHIHELIERSFRYEKQEVTIQGSIGYCFYPDDADKSEDLLQKANLALHHAETNNIATVAFEEGMQAQGRRLVLLEKQLRAGLENDEFILYYQPQLNLLTNKLEGVEALVRWQHPEKGLLPPSEFLAEMETLGMHKEFDNYILIKACQTSARWFELYQRRIAIAINITAVEFQDEQLVTNIQSLLKEYSLPSSYIELEITENVVMTDITRAMDSIVKLQSMGIKVSIDDFGTGYSSLAYLRELPIDKIKIDRSFIKEVASNDSDLTIVKSMIDLSHGLGKRVLAEGVETVEQLNVLRHLGCDAVQGYLINKPLPEEELVRYLKRK